MRIEHIGDAMLYTGDVLECLRALPDESVHCIMTSPPYWGLRDYGIAGQLGLEPMPEAYVARMVEVFREARRVLRADGTCWVNLGDSYAGGGRAGKDGQAYGGLEAQNRCNAQVKWGPPTGAIPGLKPKDLVGIPWRVAFALQADGWYLRSDIIWSKPNPMPESVTDRPTKAHEYLFLLSKEPHYFYDAEAIKEQSITDPETKASMMFGSANGKNNTSEKAHAADLGHKWDHSPTRNRRTVWTIATQPYPEAHFATFPEKLVEPCVLAGCLAQVCPECGAPWERVVERGGLVPDAPGYAPRGNVSPDGIVQAGMGWRKGKPAPNHHYERIEKGFRPTCSCGREDTVPGTLLDPFCGSGTALLVALRLGRRAIGIELKPEYMELARKRIAEEAAQIKICL